MQPFFGGCRKDMLHKYMKILHFPIREHITQYPRLRSGISWRQAWESWLVCFHLTRIRALQKLTQPEENLKKESISRHMALTSTSLPGSIKFLNARVNAGSLSHKHIIAEVKAPLFNNQTNQTTRENCREKKKKKKKKKKLGTSVYPWNPIIQPQWKRSHSPCVLFTFRRKKGQTATSSIWLICIPHEQANNSQQRSHGRRALSQSRGNGGCHCRGPREAAPPRAAPQATGPRALHGLTDPSIDFHHGITRRSGAEKGWATGQVPRAANPRTVGPPLTLPLRREHVREGRGGGVLAAATHPTSRKKGASVPGAAASADGRGSSAGEPLPVSEP